MEKKQNKHHRFWAARYVIIVVLFVLGVFFYLTDYSNMRIILLSFIGAVLVSFLWDKLFNLFRRFWVWVMILLFVCLALLIPGYFLGNLRLMQSASIQVTSTPTGINCDTPLPPKYSADLKRYEVLIEPVKQDKKISGTFNITDVIHYDLSEKQWDVETCQYKDWVLFEEDGVVHNERSVESEIISLLSHKVVVNVSNYVEIPYPDGSTSRVNLCNYSSCVETTVTLEEMPLGSIGDVQYGTLIEGPINEIDIQRAKWVATNINRGIQFSYVPYPFHLVREFIDPILDIKSVPSLAIAIASGLGGIIVKPVLEDISRNKFKEWVEKRRKDKESNSTFSQ